MSAVCLDRGRKGGGEEEMLRMVKKLLKTIYFLNFLLKSDAEMLFLGDQEKQSVNKIGDYRETIIKQVKIFTWAEWDFEISHIASTILF